MSDVAQILGGLASNNDNNNNKPRNAGPPKPPPPLPKGHHPSRAMKMTSIPKEVMDLVGGKQDPNSAALPPVVPTFTTGIPVSSTLDVDETTGLPTTTTTPALSAIPMAHKNVKIGNKWIDTSKPARKWVWAPFASSARTDGLLLSHWVRHGIDYPDYPYAKFDIHLDPISYTDEEYRDKLQHESWTKSETDQLMELARKFELRWPVIYDRWFDLYHYQVTTAQPNRDKNDKNDNTATAKTSGADGDNKQEDWSLSTTIAAPAQAALSRKIEDLQHRYYSVAAILLQHRIAQEAAAEAQALAGSVPDPAAENPKAAADALLSDTAVARTIAAGDPKHQPLIHNLGTGTSNKAFDLNYERERRAHLELLWHRTKEEEEEEVNLRKELRLVEAQIRKLKKHGEHILAAADAKTAGGKAASTTTAGAMVPSAGAVAPVAPPTAPSAAGATTVVASSRDASRSSSPAAISDDIATNSPAALLDQSFASTAPTPTPGTPYLQSGRLAPPAVGGPMGLNKTLLARMDAVLAELKIPPKPIPTKRVCDVYDSVRKDILTLLTLQKMVLQKEGQLQSKRVKLSKMGGKIQVADEETALGVPKPQPSSPAAAAASATPAAASAVAAAATPAASSTTKPKAQRPGGKGKGVAGGGAGPTGGTKPKTAAAKSAKAAPAAAADPQKIPETATKAKAGADSKAKGAEAKTKAGETKSKANTSQGATTTAKQGAAVGGKQAPGGKQAAGGKQARKPANKRKRKAEAKSPTTTAAAAAATLAVAATPAAKVLPAAAAAAAPASAPAAAPAPASKTETAGASKTVGKKRTRKN